MNIRIVLSVAIAVIAVWGGAASQLDVLFGVTASKLIVAACSLTVASLAAALGVLSTQASQSANIINDPVALAKALQAMPGVSKLLVNENATPSLAQAVNTSPKVEAAPGTEKLVADIAAKA